MSDHGDFAKAGLATKAIHAGYRPDPATGAVNTPIYASSTFAQDGVGGLRGGFEYARTGNPTRAALEASLAAVEGGAYGRAFSSGMAATDCALRAMLRPGDHLVIPNDAYGGTFRLIDKVFTHWGVGYTPAALSDLDAVRAGTLEKLPVPGHAQRSSPNSRIGASICRRVPSGVSRRITRLLRVRDSIVPSIGTSMAAAFATTSAESIVHPPANAESISKTRLSSVLSRS